MHGTADPLTKLFLSVAAGGIKSSSVRESGEAAGGERKRGEERRARLSHALHAAL